MIHEFWQNKIKAFLHDPPDKTLILGSGISHESKRDEILGKLKLKYNKQLDAADHIASAMQRLDLPKDLRKFHIYFTDPTKPVFKHTLSAAIENLEEVKDFIIMHGFKKALEKHEFSSENVKEFLDKTDWKKTYFLLWRFLPEKCHLGYFLPADTRIPDHSIWDHLDVTAAVFSSLSGGLCLFSVKIPAVQEFISHSRKLADLWASSNIFSTIIFEGIKSITEDYGPDVIIYPQLRGNPMIDLAEFKGENGKFKLLNEGKRQKLVHRGIERRLRIANFPNVFLVFIPALKAEEIRKKAENEIKRKWREIAEKAKEILGNAGINVDQALWRKQIDDAVEVTCTWLEFFNFDKFNNVKSELPDDIRKRQEEWLKFVEEVERRSNYGHFYSLTYELLGTILAQKSRFWNAWEENPVTDKKCLVCGRRNALVERFRNEKSEEEFYRYWRNSEWKTKPIDELGRLKHLLKEGERLCAVCLTKRLYGFKLKSIFEKIFHIKPPKQESVVYIAARDFIESFSTHPVLGKVIEKDIELIYEHEWGESEDKIPKEKKSAIKELKNETGKSWKELKEEVRNSYTQFGKPNKYYAILMMDGDRVGKMLSGETLPNFGEFLHPAFKNKILEWKKGKNLVNMKRILTPSHHIAISRAMKDFSLYVVPKVVKKHKGFLVYAGGDDVLALFTTDRVLEASKEIQEYFKKDFYEIDVNGEKRRVMGLGNKASMSAGIVFAHYKWPLYDAMEKVRKAEKDAKDKYGRNAFCMTFIKRSGEILTAGGKWDFVTDLTYVAKAIIGRKISHRFIHDFMEVSEILKGDMLGAEVRRLLKRRKEEAEDEEIKEIQGRLLCLIKKYEAHDLSAKELGNALKILYDAYRGEER